MPDAADSLPHIEADLLVATCSPGGELVSPNEAWQAVFGKDDENPWARLREGDRRDITTALNRVAGGALVINHLCQVHLPGREEPAPLLMNFIPVYLAEAGGEEGGEQETRPVQAITVTGEMMAEPASWTPSQTQRHRMEALGRMTMGVAHDLNNLLSALLGHAELLQKRIERHDGAGELASSVNTIEQVAVDGAALVEKIQRYSRREGQVDFETIDLSSLVEGCLTLTRPYWYNEPRRQGIAIELERDLHETPPIRGAATELREVFVNLILNAVQAMPDGGRLTLRTSYEERRGLVRAEVEDTGAGMSADVREHIFEPFFTTKGEQGSGMGLSVSYGIVQEHDGDIQVESSLGRGTRFTLLFAAVEEEADEGDAPEESTPTTRPARVLVVDDEKRVRSVLGKLLGLKGHTVEQATSGAEALALAENSNFDIVFTDYGMPAMNGRQLARALRRRAPLLPIVLLTGDADLQADSNVDRVMSKPFTLDGLETAIQELL